MSTTDRILYTPYRPYRTKESVMSADFADTIELGSTGRRLIAVHPVPTGWLREKLLHEEREDVAKHITNVLGTWTRADAAFIEAVRTTQQHLMLIHDQEADGTTIATAPSTSGGTETLSTSSRPHRSSHRSSRRMSTSSANTRTPSTVFDTRTTVGSSITDTSSTATVTPHRAQGFGGPGVSALMNRFGNVNLGASQEVQPLLVPIAPRFSTTPGEHGGKHRHAQSQPVLPILKPVIEENSSEVSTVRGPPRHNAAQTPLRIVSTQETDNSTPVLRLRQPDGRAIRSSQDQRAPTSSSPMPTTTTTTIQLLETG
jgi:hypothetical protein